MTITRKELSEGCVEFAVTGRLETATAPQLSDELTDLTGISELSFDFTDLDYISSGGLRVLLSTYKRLMVTGGKVIVKNINDGIKEIMELTGFNEILDIR